MMSDESEFKESIEEMSDEEIRQQQERTREMEMPEIRALDYLYGREEVTYTYPELTAMCPMTATTEIYTVRLIYRPGAKVPELKSLKYYFLAFRDVPVLHEHLAGRIFDDFNAAVEPAALRVELEAAVRGGIRTKVVKTGDDEGNA